MAIFVKTIKVPKTEAKRLQSFLDGNGDNSDNVIATFSTHFKEQGRGVDIKVCDGDGPYVDPVLFEVVPADAKDRKVGIRYNWHEIGPLDVTDTLLGEYEFEDEGNTYLVKVIVAPANPKTKKNIRRWVK